MALIFFGAVVGISILQGEAQPCFPPGRIENGELLQAREGFYAVTDEVQYRCLPGYQTSDPIRLTCTVSGQWDLQPPNCTLAPCHVSLLHVELYRPIKDVYHWGDVITVERCDPGFQLMTKNTFRCGFESPVVCAGIPCPQEALQAVRNGRVEVEGRAYVGTKVNVVCDPGFVLGSASNFFLCGKEPPPRCHRMNVAMELMSNTASNSIPDGIPRTCLPLALGIALLVLSV